MCVLYTVHSNVITLLKNKPTALRIGIVCFASKCLFVPFNSYSTLLTLFHLMGLQAIFTEGQLKDFTVYMPYKQSNTHTHTHSWCTLLEVNRRRVGAMADGGGAVTQLSNTLLPPRLPAC